MDEEVVLARYISDGIEKKVTVSNYNQFILKKEKDSLADFIYGRLHSRYINPFEEHGSINKRKNGFSMMANYCLLIETLQSFINGWGDSDRKSGVAFKQFFTENKNFTELNEKGMEIYKHIRCGILHQGETTNGWRITREGIKLLDENNKIIDAYIFGKRITKSLNDYKQCLKLSEWTQKNGIISG